MSRSVQRLISPAALLFLAGCAETTPPMMRRPADEYVARIKQDAARQQRANAQAFQSRAAVWDKSAAAAPNDAAGTARARLHLAGGELPYDGSERMAPGAVAEGGVVSNLGGEPIDESRIDELIAKSQADANIRDYTGPLNLGDPGVSASLWKESRGGNDLFRDYRAFQPMDLITIVVNESTSGKKEGNTEVTQESSFSAALRNLLGIENWNQLDVFDSGNNETGDGADLSNLVRATTSSEFKGDGQTERKGRLTGKISAMIAEVLPSGVMRIEGEKIISLNSEEEVMVISGLIRPEDVNSSNEVDSSKIANVRIDYYGNGTIGDAQRGGWLGRFFRRWWPF